MINPTTAKENNCSCFKYKTGVVDPSGIEEITVEPCDNCINEIIKLDGVENDKK